MSYSTENDLADELGMIQLARLSGDPGGVVLNSTRINAAIAGADEMIDAYLRGRYTLPPDAGGIHLIKRISVDIAVFNLYLYEGANRIMPDEIYERKKRAMELLIKIQAGDIALPGYTSALQSPPKIISNKTFADRIFGKEKLNEF